MSSLSLFPCVPAGLALPGVSMQSPHYGCWPPSSQGSVFVLAFYQVEQLFCDASLRSMYFQICSGCFLASICDSGSFSCCLWNVLRYYFHSQRMVGIVGIRQCCKRPQEYIPQSRSIVFGEPLLFSKAVGLPVCKSKPTALYLGS